MSSPYDYWNEALAGRKPKMFVDDPQFGFYRKSISERNDKGNSRRIGWEPVAIFHEAGKMVAVVGEQVIKDRDKINELWTWVANNPISEAWYRTVDCGNPWPDAHDPSKNKPSAAPQGEQSSHLTPEEILISLISEAKAGVSQYDKIDSDTMAGQALSLKNEITDFAGKLDKVRESLVRPHIDAQREVNDRLNPVIKDAKWKATQLLRAIGGWEDTKRESAKAAEQSGEKPNAPAPSAQVAAAVGRKASVKVAKFVTDIDLDNAFAQFRNEPAVKDILMQCAQKAVNAGMTVDGATIEERSVVR